jgi:hypothetical protein
VAQDDHGSFIPATDWFIPHVDNVDSAEISAVKNGTYLTSQIGCSNLLIESDCSFVVEAMQQSSSYAGPDVSSVMGV